jgi:acyl carrier protein
MHERIKSILGGVKENPDLARSLPDNADIINDVGLDSLQMISFILTVEEEFGIQFDFDGFDYSYLNSIDEFARYLSGMKGVSGAVSRTEFAEER